MRAACSKSYTVNVGATPMTFYAKATAILPTDILTNLTAVNKFAFEMYRDVVQPALNVPLVVVNLYVFFR